MNSAHRHLKAWLGLSLTLATHSVLRADTANLEIAEFGLTGANAPSVELLSFPVQSGNTDHTMSISLPAGPASVSLARALSSRQLLAAPSLRFTRTPPSPFHLITFFDASVSSIDSFLPASPPGAVLQEQATFKFSRYERTHTLSPGISHSLFVDCETHTLTHTTDAGAPPAIDPLPPISFPAGSSFDLPLGITDPDSPVPSLVLSFVHPTSPLLPPGSITISPPGPTTQASFTLPPGITGSVVLTFIADDGNNRGMASVELSVTPANNDSPTNIILSNDTLAENSPDGQTVATISVTDPTPLDSHTLTLNDNAGGRFEIVGNELLVADSSLLDFEITNVHFVTITAVDLGGNTFSKSFQIHLTDVAEGPFDTWRAAHFNADQLADPLISGPFADPDKNGFPNLAEYNGNSNPLDPRSTPPPLLVEEILHEGQIHPTLSWRQRTHASDPLMETHPQFSTDAILWVEDTLAFVITDTVPAGANHEQITARLISPRTSSDKGFFRLRLRRIDP